MSITSPISTVTNRTTTEVKDKTTMGKDDFLKLLMAQLGNQDPSAPMDAQAFVAQLATLSAVEAQQKTNQQLDNLVMAQAANNQLQAAALLGDTVTFKSNTVDVATAGKPSTIALDMAAAGNVTLTIKDDNGKVIRTLRPAGMGAGNNSVTWDGMDEKGNPVKAGHYKVTATAADASGAVVDVTVLRRGRVDGLGYGKGYPELRIGSDTITLAEVRDVEAPATPVTTP